MKEYRIELFCIEKDCSIQLYVFKNKEELQQYCKNLFVISPECDACFMPIEHEKYDEEADKWVNGGCFGNIMFHQEALGDGLIAHEATHATIEFYRRKYNFFVPFDDEEEFADIVGFIVKSIVNLLYEEGLFLEE